jgi:hypothetical protein
VSYAVEWFGNGQWNPITRHWFYFRARREIGRRITAAAAVYRWRLTHNGDEVFGLMRASGDSMVAEFNAATQAKLKRHRRNHPFRCWDEFVPDVRKRSPLR